MTRGGLSAREIAADLKAADVDELIELIERYADDPRKGVRLAVERARRALERRRAEEERVRGLYERAWEIGGHGLVFGVDEVGRGAVAGPLTVAAVALAESPLVLGVDDSKRLTPRKREEVAASVREKARAIGYGFVSPERIDEIGMARALREAMAAAIEAASEDAGAEPDAVLIDGNPVHVHPKEICVVKGDATLAPVAAASVVAKVTRDALMVEAERTWPGYGFAASKGYASAAHIAAIRDRGLTPFHRATFCTRFGA